MRLAKIAGVVLLSVVLLSFIACATPTYHLSTSVNGQGSVMPSSGDYLEDESVILLANPASGWDFDHWEGAASGEDGLVTITMNSDKAVTAYFVETGETGTATTPAFSTYIDDYNEFMMSIPSSWEAISLEEAGALFGSDSVCSGGGASGFVMKVDAIDSDLQTFYHVTKIAAEMSEGYTFISEDEATIDGMPAMKFIYTDVSEGATSKWMQCVLIHNNTGWWFMFICDSECWDSMESTFNVMLNSFHVLD